MTDFNTEAARVRQRIEDAREQGHISSTVREAALDELRTLTELHDSAFATEKAEEPREGETVQATPTEPDFSWQRLQIVESLARTSRVSAPQLLHFAKEIYDWVREPDLPTEADPVPETREHLRDERHTAQDIAEAVRRHCTPGSEAYNAGGDAIVRAVADWIENPPEWVDAPWRVTF